MAQNYSILNHFLYTDTYVSGDISVSVLYLYSKP